MKIYNNNNKIKMLGMDFVLSIKQNCKRLDPIGKEVYGTRFIATTKEGIVSLFMEVNDSIIVEYDQSTFTDQLLINELCYQLVLHIQQRLFTHYVLTGEIEKAQEVQELIALNKTIHANQGNIGEA